MTENAVRFKGQAYDVTSQTPAVTDESLAEARRLIGVDLRAQRSTSEVTRDIIRDYCNYIGSSNPLFLDEEYARRTRWGGVIAPPTLILGPCTIGPGLRGIQWIFAGTDWEWYRVVRVGDIITTRGKLIEAQEKRGQTVSRMVLQIGEMTYTNQRGELVARCKTYMMRTPRTKAEGGMGYRPRLQRWSDEELARIEAGQDAEEVRGEAPRYWEDTQVGEAMKPVLYGPLRTVDIAFTRAEDLETHAGAHAYQFLERRRHPADTYVDPVTGIQDHPHRGHWEEFMAREVGMPGIYDIGSHRLAWLCRFVTDWMGDDAFLVRLSGRLRRPNVVADITYVKGRVTARRVETGEHLVDCEVWCENQLGEVTLPGGATIALPSRAMERATP